MQVNHKPDCGRRPVREDGSLLILALLAFAAGGISGFVGAVFRLVLDQSDRFRDAVIDWAHGKEIAGFALLICVSAFATGLAAWLVRKFAPGAKGSGIPDVEAVLRDKQPPPPLILIPVKFLGGVLATGAVTGLMGVAYNRTLLGALAAAERVGCWRSIDVRGALVGAAVGLLAWFGPGSNNVTKSYVITPGLPRDIL